MFRTKICGVTTVDDALVVRDAGADAIGLNFYAKSPRFVALELAAAIRQAVSSLMVVGVFVNSSTSEVRRIAAAVGLSAVQLHGDEPPAAEQELTGLPVVRAKRMDERGVEPIAAALAESQAVGRRPDAVLVDAAVRGAYGGTGAKVDWATLAQEKSQLAPTPLILAGGLTPDNVGEAIRSVSPLGVDTASGVESAPGVKDAELVRAFVAAVENGYEALG